jgi:hypothetical protein
VDGQLYKMVIEASGEVRDEDGNLVSSEPLRFETTLSEAEVLAQIASQTNKES